MIDWKKLGKKILFPPVPLTIILSVLSAASLTAVFVLKKENSLLAYFIFAISFYSLSVFCIFAFTKLPKLIKNAKIRINGTKYGEKYMTDPVFRTRVSLYISLFINLLYAAVNLISGHIYGSAWFFILAVYYTVLSVMRFLLLRYSSEKTAEKNIIKEYKQSRFCAVILLTVNLSLSGTVLMMMYQNRGFEYKGMLIYVMAAYTFYITIHTAVNLVKYRRFSNPVMSTAKAVSFTSAMISMLSLETAMFSAFGADMPLKNQQILIAVTGAMISIILITMSAFIIKKANTEIKHLKKEQNNGKQ